MPTKKRPAKKQSPSQSSYESHFEHSALFEFSKVINSSLDPKFISSHILLTIMGKILSTKGMVIVEQSSERYAIETVKGFPQELVGTTLQIKKLPQSLFAVEKLNTSRYPWAKFFKKMGVQILLPMFIAEKPIGMLGFGERFSKKKLKAMEVTYLRSLANISATAIEKSRTIDELQQVNRKLDRKIQELNTLFDLGKEFGAVLDPEKLVKLLVFSLLGQIGVNRYLIGLTQGPDVRIAASRVDGSPPQSELLRSLSTVKSPLRVQEMHAKSLQDARDVLQRVGMAVVVPMLLQGENKGVILLGEKLNREPYGASDLEFLSSLANLAIIALENARLFKEAIEKQRMEDELLIAREIQKGLLPSELPSLPGCDIAATNISSKQVGGDYYDVIAAEGGRHIIAIGDVSGKGTPAALLMANLQATIRALVPLNLPLSELTARVNNLMCHNTGGDKFVTFFWGYFDAHARTLTYVNAGHNYPYLIRPDGSIVRLEKGGMILGIMPALVPYEMDTIQFISGDLLVLFTDGVSEAMSRTSEEYGEERMEVLLLRERHLSSQNVIDALLDDILRHTAGGPQSDDITMMVMKIA